MKGHFDRLQHQYNSMQDVVATLQARVADTPATAPVERPRLVTPEEEQDYGEQLLSVVARRAREEMQPEIERLQSLVQQNVQVTAEQARSRMYSALDSSVPAWQQINAQKEFLDWLALPDVFSGARRMELLKAAFERNDATRVIAFFNGFLSDEAAVAPQTQPSPAAVEQPQKVPLEKFAAPGGAKTAAPPAPVEKPIIATADITKFYSDVAAGHYRGREVEKDRLERMIFEAQAEGRIR
jgi:hypothetical protein